MVDCAYSAHHELSAAVVLALAGPGGEAAQQDLVATGDQRDLAQPVREGGEGVGEEPQTEAPLPQLTQGRVGHLSPPISGWQGLARVSGDDLHSLATPEHRQHLISELVSDTLKSFLMFANMRKNKNVVIVLLLHSTLNTAPCFEDRLLCWFWFNVYITLLLHSKNLTLYSILFCFPTYLGGTGRN